MSTLEQRRRFIRPRGEAVVGMIRTKRKIIRVSPTRTEQFLRDRIFHRQPRHVSRIRCNGIPAIYRFSSPVKYSR